MRHNGRLHDHGRAWLGRKLPAPEHGQGHYVSAVHNVARANQAQAEAFARTKFEAADSPADLKFAHGTTTLGFVFKHGVVIAVDSRSTQGPYIGRNRRLPAPPPQTLTLCSLAVCEEGA